MVRDSNKLDGGWWRPAVDPGGGDHIGALLRNSLLAITEVIDRRLAAAGYGDLTPALLRVAQHVKADGSRITELAAQTQLTKPTVVHAVDELVRLGYARREADPLDGRAKLVTMTERGVDAERVGRETIMRVRDAWAGELGEKKVAQLESLLRELRDVLWP